MFCNISNITTKLFVVQMSHESFEQNSSNKRYYNIHEKFLFINMAHFAHVAFSYERRRNRLGILARHFRKILLFRAKEELKHLAMLFHGNNYSLFMLHRTLSPTIMIIIFDTFCKFQTFLKAEMQRK